MKPASELCGRQQTCRSRRTYAFYFTEFFRYAVIQYANTSAVDCQNFFRQIDGRCSRRSASSRTAINSALERDAAPVSGDVLSVFPQREDL